MRKESVDADDGFRLIRENFQAAVLERRRQINLHGAERGGFIGGDFAREDRRVREVDKSEGREQDPSAAKK